MRLVTGVAVDVPSELRLAAEGFAFAAASPVAVVVATWLAAGMPRSVMCGDMLVEVFSRGIVVVACTPVDGPLATMSTAAVRRLTCEATRRGGLGCI